MSQQILTTKLFMARPQGNLVAREQLMRKLDEIPRRRLTLVSAPAGFGKTTAIASWIEASGMPAAWVSLDAIDNDPTRFFSYVVAALRTVHPSIGADVAEALEAPRGPGMEQLLGALVNDLAGIREDFILVLDDYHAIENERLHEALLFILERAPASLHLVLTTRVDPPIPLARLRVRGSLLEIRAADLRFTSQDALTFFNERMRLDLKEEHLEALQSKTEGWVAGLQMAALSLQGRDDVEEFITAFTGADRYVLDYLLEEVLALLPPDLQRVMPELAVLERFNGDLCEAVAGCDGGAELLAELERRNLFVISLDNRREWYRYHHLFGDLLLHRLRQQHPDMVKSLHRRASLWYAERGMPAQATSHARSADDPELIGSVMERFWRSVLNDFPLDQMIGTMESLPPHVLAPSMHLRLLRIWALLFDGEYPRVLEMAEDLERMLEGKESDPEVREVIGHIWYMRAAIIREAGDVERTLEYAERALTYLPDYPANSPNYLWNTSHGMLWLIMASVISLAGDSRRAVPLFEQAVQFGRSHNDYFTQSAALSNLCREYALIGCLTLAEEKAEELRQVVTRFAVNMVDVGAVPYQVRARTLHDRYKLEEAREMIAVAKEHSDRSRPSQWIELHRLLYMIETTAGDLAAARAAIDEMERVEIPPHAERAGMVPPMLRADLAWRTGDVNAAMEWGQGIIDGTVGPGVPRTFILRGLEEMVLVQALHAAGRSEEAMKRLDPFLEELKSVGQIPNLIEMLVVRAGILEDTGAHDAAIESVLGALKHGAREGIVSSFARGGERVARLLVAIEKKGLASAAHLPAHYLKAVAEACGAPGAVPTQSPAPISETSPNGFGELASLTSREREILQLMAMGYSNQKIADKLYVSINTIKTHIANLFDKLGARSRVEALLRARESKLL